MRFLKRGEGYTFIELLLAVTILAFITAPLLGLLATACIAIRSAGDQTTAVNLGRAAMEAVKAAGFDAAYETYIIGGQSPLIEESLPEDPRMRREIAVTLAPSPSGMLQDPELLQIRVAVSWPARGTEQVVVLESYLCRR
ncbi:MAG TPA: hypothetical protein PLY40_03305 [Bacillota bacterium]|nr:hypothetical protein [Bacillota bacterium]